MCHAQVGGAAPGSSGGAKRHSGMPPQREATAASPAGAVNWCPLKGCGNGEAASCAWRVRQPATLAPPMFRGSVVGAIGHPCAKHGPPVGSRRSRQQRDPRRAAPGACMPDQATLRSAPMRGKQPVRRVSRGTSACRDGPEDDRPSDGVAPAPKPEPGRSLIVQAALGIGGPTPRP